MARRSRNAAAFERTVTALRNGGRLEAVDAALVAAGRTMAQIMDAAEEPVVPVTWAYLSILRELRGVVTPDADEGLGQLIAALSAPMGDAPES
jgi:hypothetical protein